MTGKNHALGAAEARSADHVVPDSVDRQVGCSAQTRFDTVR
jgi:hypothetical protein